MRRWEAIHRGPARFTRLQASAAPLLSQLRTLKPPAPSSPNTKPLARRLSMTDKMSVQEAVEMLKSRAEYVMDYFGESELTTDLRAALAILEGLNLYGSRWLELERCWMFDDGGTVREVTL